MHVCINKSNAVKEASDHPGFCIGPTLLNREIYYSMLVYFALKGLCSRLKLSEARNISYADKARSKKEVIDYYVLPLLERLEEIIKDPSSESSTIVRFCRPIIEKLSVFARNSDVKITTDFQKAYRDKWSFYDLMNDGDFKQTYVNTAVDELDKSTGESLREGINRYVKSVEEGKEVASRHFEKKIAFQAYCEETDNANRTLNVNLIDYNGSEPIKISDILQQEKDIGKLDIYCNKNHDICARREGKKRYYEFEEKAHYQMTSTWPIKDEFGNVGSICTMVMNVSSKGITGIRKFDNGGKSDLQLKEILGLIEQNEELHIQGLSLYKAVGAFLETQRGLGCGREDIVPIKKERCNSSPDVVPVTNSSGDNIDSNPPALSSANSDAPTQTGVNLQGNGIQAETDLQQQKIDKLVQDSQELRNELNEVNSMIGGLMQNFENIKSNKSRHSIKLYNEVAKLKESYGEFNEEMSRIQSKVKKIWHLLPKEERSYEYRIRGGRCYSLCNSSTGLSSNEEGYGSDKEVIHF